MINLELRKAGTRKIWGHLLRASASPRGNVSLRLLLPDHPSLDLLDAGMVGHGMDRSVAAAEETAQDPADEPDHDTCKEGGPEAGDMESGNDLGDEKDQQRIDHQDEEAHGHDDEGETEEEQDRAHQGVDDAEQESRAEERPGGVVRNTRNEPSGTQNGEGGDEPTEEELFHGAKHTA